MKTRSLIIGLLMITSLAMADSKSESIINAFSQKIDSYNSYSVDFTATAEEYMPMVKGNFIVSDQKYYVNISDIEVFFDGSIRQTYNSLDNELIVEKSLPESEGLLANPTNIFRLNISEFESQMLDSSDPKEHVISLKPLDDQMIDNLVIYINKSTGLLSKIVMDDQTSDMSIVFIINEFSPNIAISPNTFSFDMSGHKDVEVIEF